jgi:CubicO group peptidase (beta-lactamase class C family)
MKKVALILFVLLFCGSFSAQTIEERIAEIDAYAQKVMSDWHQPGMAIAIVKEDKVVFAKGYGTRQLGKNEPVDADTDFAIASNSKAFTVASLAILVDEKKLAWNDKVTKYLPDFKLYDPYVTSELTIRDLVTHRVGLDTFSGDLLWYETDYSSDEILQRVRFLKPVSGFRTQFGYSNLMFIAAGKVIEKVSGNPWCTYVTEHILSAARHDPHDLQH